MQREDSYIKAKSAVITQRNKYSKVNGVTADFNGQIKAQTNTILSVFFKESFMVIR